MIQLLKFTGSMKKTLFTLVVFLFFLHGIIKAQYEHLLSPEQQIDRASLAIGLGLDYGGIGLNGLFYPKRNLGFFAGAGYAFADFGYNIGTKLRFTKKDSLRKVTPYLTAMYGYNTAVIVSDADHSKLFYGFSFGAGLDLRFSPRNGYWTFGLLFPVRAKEVDDYIDDLKNNHGIRFDNELLPVALSIGYRFILN